MGSFILDEYIGDGVLKNLVSKLLEEGWDDIPTLKLMNSDDMNSLNMNQQQKDALEIRSHLHDRGLMQYGDKLELSGKSLPEILNMSILDLASEFGMKRGHIARFTNRKSPCLGEMPPTYVHPSRKKAAPLRSISTYVLSSHKKAAPLRSMSENVYQNELFSSDPPKIVARTFTRRSKISSQSMDNSIFDVKIKEGHVFKGIVAAEPSGGNASCGCIQGSNTCQDNILAPYSSIENISVQKLAPEYNIGMEPLVKTKTPPMRASELWRDRPAILLCIRRPGCIMCRAEAHQLYARKPFFDALGVQLIAVLLEHIDSEVKDFWPRYWGGVVVLDREMNFFRALGGGKLLKDKFIKGFIFNPRAIANYRRAKAMGIAQNFKGEGEIKGGLFIVGSGKSGIAYQFIERNFGDWAPVSEVIEICTRIQVLHN